MTELPIISVIIPTRNEEDYIVPCLRSVVENDYPADRMELLVVDGMSTDRTLELVNGFVANEKGIALSVIPNPKQIFPCAVNLGVAHSKGEYILILGAHATYDASYLKNCAETALRTGADNTGGILITEGLNRSMVGRAITHVLSSRFGVGNSTFRTGCDAEMEVDTVFGGFYKREIFERIGNFNENLISTSDMDFNVRLKQAGGKIILNPAIQATYYTRTDFRKFVRNNYRNGFWAIYPLKFLAYLPVRFRHLIPLFFFGGLICGIALALVVPYLDWAFMGAMALYFFIGFIFSLRYVGKNPLNIFLMPFLLFILHAVYGLGSFVALFKVIFIKSAK